MTLNEFSNVLRILRSLDIHEIPPAWDRDKISRFFSDPARFFIRADDKTQKAIWSAIQARLPDAQARAA